MKAFIPAIYFLALSAFSSAILALVFLGRLPSPVSFW